MTVLPYVHGTAALVVICGLLFVDEAGVPLPLAPSEVLLLLTGVLISSGAAPSWILLPIALLCMTGGMIAGYGWARTLGEAALCRLAEQVGATNHYDRASRRLARASPVSIGLARLIPGVRPYATLASGASELDLRRFLLGATPALLIWAGVWIGLGLAIGLPAEQYLGRVEKPLFEGGVLLVAGVVAFLGLRRATREVDLPVRWVPRRGRRLLAAVIDAGMVGSIAAGLLLLARVVFSFSSTPWLDPLLIAAVAIGYLVVRPSTPWVTADGIFVRPEQHQHTNSQAPPTHPR